MNYYLANVIEYNGDFQHTTTVRFAIPDSISSVGAHQEIVSNWYSDLVENELGWWTPCGTVAVNQGKLTKINQEVFDALADHDIIRLFK